MVPDLLKLFGPTLSLKLKSHSTWTDGTFLYPNAET